MRRGTRTERSRETSGRDRRGRCAPSHQGSHPLIAAAGAAGPTGAKDRQSAPWTHTSREERYRQLVEGVKAIPWELDLGSRRFTGVGPYRMLAADGRTVWLRDIVRWW